jgi:hypothetical protein
MTADPFGGDGGHCHAHQGDDARAEHCDPAK